MRKWKFVYLSRVSDQTIIAVLIGEEKGVLHSIYYSSKTLQNTDQGTWEWRKWS
jgi:hypothetical protein